MVSVMLATGGFSARGETTPRRVELCAEGSADLRTAKRHYERLEQRVREGRRDGEAAEPLQELEALLKLPCYALARLDESGFRPPTSWLSLRAWWDSGGDVWLRSYLSPVASLEVRGTSYHPMLQTVFAPTPRRALTLGPGAPPELHSILCPPDPGDCGVETRGWVDRAMWSFRHRVSRDEAPRMTGVPTPFHLDPDCPSPEGKEVADYQQWRACVAHKTPLGTALPLGRFRAPNDGWLVVLGPTSHGGSYCRSCDEIRAYDLARGDAFVSHRCRCPDPMHGYDYVCPAEPSGAEQNAVQHGSVLLDNAREAALIVMLAPYAENQVRPVARAFRVPDGLRPAWQPERPDRTLLTAPIRAGLERFDAFDGPATWAWLRPGKPTVTGEVARWRPAGDYAAETLAVLDASFVEARRPTPVPEGLLVGLAELKYPKSGERAFPSLIKALRHPPTRTLAELTEPREVQPLATECVVCQTDADCGAPLFCMTFGDGTRRCGQGDGTTTCRVQ